MTALVTILDDDGFSKEVRTMKPVRICEEGIKTRYVFEFEYIRLNYDKYRQKSGKWIPIPYELEYETDAKCSLCGELVVDGIGYNYCPNCGARMIREAENV